MTDKITMNFKVIISFLSAYSVTLLVLFSHNSVHSDHHRRPAEDVSAQNRGWRISLSDGFGSPDQESMDAQRNELPFDYSCYTRKEPECEYPFWSKRTCDEWKANNPIIRQNLSHLNKCRWRIYNKYNWMDFDIPEGEGVNSFHESQVVVQNGKLHLKANKNPDWLTNKDCKNKMYSGPYSNYSIDCPIISGGIESHPWGNHDEANDIWQFGFEQAYGRWEINAKLPNGPGIWPGLWMLPMWSNPNPDPVQNTGGKVDCGWPHNGEFDLLETWSDSPNEAHQGYIHGNCGKDMDVRGGFNTKGLDLVNQFHTYGMEWGENYLKFFIDDEVTGTIWKGDRLKAKYRSGSQEGKRTKEDAWIPSYPFHWILNLSIEGMKDKEKLKPKYESWSEKEVVIDHVKVFRRCTQEEFDQDALRPVEKKLCQHFKTDKANTADEYQSTRGETANASMMAYPNPYRIGFGEIKVEFKLFQDCQNVKLDLVNMLGQVVQPGTVQLVAENSELNPKNHYFHDGPLHGDFKDNNLLYTFRFTPNQSMAAGMYLIRAEYDECAIYTRDGLSYSGQGNYVWKQVIIK